MIKAILVTREKSDNHEGKHFTDHIKQVEVPLKILPTKRKFTKPVPFYYNMITEFKKDFQDILDISKYSLCMYDYISYYFDKKFSKYSLFMVTETVGSWNIDDQIKLNGLYGGIHNESATSINKYHDCYSNTLFIYCDINLDQIKYMDTDRINFIANIYENREMKGNVFVSSREIFHNDETEKNKYESLLKMCEQFPNFKLIQRENKVPSEINSLIDLYYKMVRDDIVLENKSLSNEELFKKCVGLAKTDDREVMIDWLLHENSDKMEKEKDIDFMYQEEKKVKNSKKLLALKEKNRELRLGFAKNYIDYLSRNLYTTLENTYLVIGPQINDEYVKKGYPWYQSGNNFHGIQEGSIQKLTMDYGVSHKSIEEDNVSNHDQYLYLYKISHSIIKPDNYDLYNNAMKEYKSYKEP